MPQAGGSFYSNETVDSAKSHYVTCWPILVRASALWLNEEGFELAAESVAEKDARNSSWFHLLLGLCVEALSTPTADAPVDPVPACLSALAYLFKCSWPCDAIARDEPTCVELLGVMHRILLAYTQRERQSAALLVVRAIVLATVAREERDRVGSDRLDVGKSVVFATLQIAMCVLFRRFPFLKEIGGDDVVATRSRLTGSDDDELAAIVIGLIPAVLELCDAETSVDVLPTVLLIVVNVWKVAVTLATSRALLSSCLQALKTIFTCSLLDDEQSRKQWIELLQSAYFTILDSAEELTSSPDNQTFVNVLVSLGSIHLSAPESVTATEMLIQKSVAIFKSALNSKESQVRKIIPNFSKLT